jgi:hypothetical protein
MQICDGCGQDVDGGADTCPNCGEDLAPPRTDSRTPVESEKPTDTASDYSLLAALLLGIASWIFLQFAFNTRIGLDYCLSTTFFWLFFFCVAGAVASLLRKLYLVALSSTVTVTIVGIILLFLTMSYRLDFISLVLIAIGILGTSILARSRSEFKSGPESPGKLKDGKVTLKRIGPGGIVPKVLAVLVVVVVLTVVYLSYDDCDSALSKEGYYEVQVRMASGADYELIVPIPVDSSLVVWDLVNFIEITEGNGSWEVVQTSFGPGLRITGSGNVTLRCEDLEDANRFRFLSPQNRSLDEWGRGWEMPFLVFADASGSEDALGFSVVADYNSAWGGTTTTLESEPGDLVWGWQVVWGDQEEWEH